MSDIESRLKTAGIITWHAKGRYYARQDVHQASVSFAGDAVKSAWVRAEARARALAALVKLKTVVQQLRRPPAPDSRPRRCHAKPKGVDLVCRPCKVRWCALDTIYPDCEGDR